MMAEGLIPALTGPEIGDIESVRSSYLDLKVVDLDEVDEAEERNHWQKTSFTSIFVQFS